MAEHAYTTPEHEAEWQRLRELRRQAEAALEQMLDILNRIDGDPDLEDGGDAEPTMGAPEGLAGQSRDEWGRGTPNDECEHEDGDAELGWANEGSQLRLTASALDQEPSLWRHGRPL